MRYSVLTYIFNGYEKVHEVLVKDPGAEYVLVTDDPTLKSETWEVVYDHRLKGMTPFEKCYEVRYHPFRYVKNYIVVRLDGAIEIRESLMPLLSEFERGQYDRCLMIHPQRNTMPDEYAAWVELRGYPEEQAKRCLELMKHLGYDMTYKGLFQACFEIVRDNRCNRLINDITFDLLRYAAADGHMERVNQTWLSFVINHLFDKSIKILPVSERVMYGHPMQWYRHTSDTPEREKEIVEPWMFNKPCSVAW